ncbi:MAG: hypothetical protein KBE65_02600 [Phycisphaerae bacterium]|nr:hypothetical protein [Phycisphaerae bacterium]
MGWGQFDGLMVSDGERHRIAIYWVEPDIFRDGTPFVRYTDFIFGPDVQFYWAYPSQQRDTVILRDNPGGALLPRENSGESTVRSALAMVNRMKDQGTDIQLAVGMFFQGSRGMAEYTYESPPGESDGNNSSSTADSDVQILNALPGGRRYSKEKQSDGVFVWRETNALSGQPVVVVIIKPAMRIQANACPGVFDPNTLGQWTLIPEPHRTYWAFDQAYCELDDATDECAASRELHDRIEFYLDGSNVPRQVHWGMERLAIKTAIMTDDMDRVRRSVQEAVGELCADPSIGRHRCLLELARISGLIQTRYPEEPQEWLRPFISHVVDHAGPEGVVNYLDKLMPTIEANKWLIYADLLLDEVRRQGITEEQALHRASLRLEGVRLSEEKRQRDPCESSPSVRDYLARLDTDPPPGTINMNEVRHILEGGLAKCCADGGSEADSKLVEDIVQSIRLIVGEGPFRGDPNKLAQSVERFSRCHSVVNGGVEGISTVLATFLALSFCDLSTAEDHDKLLSQFCRCSADLKSQMDAMLRDRRLGSLVTPDDVDRVIGLYERIFHRYVDDPLWPTFKFPWTTDEEARLASRLKLHVVGLEPLLDDMSIKVKYGGTSAELKARIVEDISRTVQQLLPEAAFLRKPLYPGVSCQYRGGYGFTAIIKRPLYREGDQPREKFNAMKYFHLGHRLERVVEHERELIQPSGAQEPSQ